MRCWSKSRSQVSLSLSLIRSLRGTERDMKAMIIQFEAQVTQVNRNELSAPDIWRFCLLRAAACGAAIRSPQCGKADGCHEGGYRGS